MVSRRQYAISCGHFERFEEPYEHSYFVCICFLFEENSQFKKKFTRYWYLFKFILKTSNAYFHLNRNSVQFFQTTFSNYLHLSNSNKNFLISTGLTIHKNISRINFGTSLSHANTLQFRNLIINLIFETLHGTQRNKTTQLDSTYSHTKLEPQATETIQFHNDQLSYQLPRTSPDCSRPLRCNRTPPPRKGFNFSAETR